MEYFVRAGMPGWIFSAPEEKKNFIRFLQSLPHDKRNSPQYVRLMQVYGNLQNPSENKRKLDESQDSSECHSVLGTTQKSTQEDL